MQLTVRDVIEMFNVGEATVVRWVKEKELPAQRVNGRFRFNRFELLEWAIAHHINVRSYTGASPLCLSLADALLVGGIHYDVPGVDPRSVLLEVVSRLPITEDVDRESLLKLFIARESLGSTAVGDGIAIPHARHPIVLDVQQNFVTLCFLNHPIAYDAPDGKPVSVLFTLISPTVVAHVQLLGGLSRALKDSIFRQELVATKSRETIIRAAWLTEQKEHSPKSPTTRAAA